MTDTDFPFGDSADPAADQPAVIEPASELRTNVLIGAGGALAAIAMAAGFVVFAGNDSDQAGVALPGPRPIAAAPGAAKPSPSASPGPRVEPAPATETIGRDPFAPLYTAPVTAVAAVGQPPAGGSGTPVVPVVQPAVQQPAQQPASQPVQQPAQQPASQPAPVSTPAPAPVAPASYQMRMLRVYEQDGRLYSEVTVNGTVYRPKVGETFASYFQLVATQDPCATYLYGDEQFRLCEGEITVRQ